LFLIDLHKNKDESPRFKKKLFFLLAIELVPLLLKVQQPKANSLSLNYFQRELKR
jgi:hypothetical protein